MNEKEKVTIATLLDLYIRAELSGDDLASSVQRVIGTTLDELLDRPSLPGQQTSVGGCTSGLCAA